MVSWMLKIVGHHVDSDVIKIFSSIHSYLSMRIISFVCSTVLIFLTLSLSKLVKLNQQHDEWSIFCLVHVIILYIDTYLQRKSRQYFVNL
jgi:competence protein ComGF